MTPLAPGRPRRALPLGGRRESTRSRVSRASKAGGPGGEPQQIKRTLTHKRVAVGRGSLSSGSASVARTGSGNFILRRLSSLTGKIGMRSRASLDAIGVSPAT